MHENEKEITGILHCHSSYSYDGKLPLRELRELCIKRGVHFVCMTEHADEMTPDTARAFIHECDRLSDTTFKFIPGFEVDYELQGHEGLYAHILMIGCREFFKNRAADFASLREWTEHAPFVVLAHPVRNDFEVDEGLLGELDALEVWNQQYEGKRVPRTQSLALLEELRHTKSLLVATGGVDFHRIEHFGSPQVTLSPDTFTEGAILEKLKTGAFTVHSDRAQFFGTLPNVHEFAHEHRFESFVSVSIIDLGKWVNKALAEQNLSLPKWLKQLVRRRL
jgi:predicted metal-dependent phosphoesterase TrpH